MKKPITRVGAQRRGHDYQDLIALELLIDWLGHSDRYQWIKVEAAEAGFLDDVIALRSDNQLVALQVKFSNHPDEANDPWTWEELLERKSNQGTSLLQKWSHTLKQLLQTWQIAEATVISNRRFGDEIASAQVNRGEHIDLDSITLGKTKTEIIQQLGGEEQAREFFQTIRFRLNYANLEDLEERLKQEFLYTLKGTERGWNNLKEQLRSWVIYKDQPHPDRRIFLEDIRLAAQWNTLNELPQEFMLPSDYILPSESFHQQILKKAYEQDTECIVITGHPGVGKSSYCSYLYQQLKNAGAAVIRHHYYLSNSDGYRTARLEYEQAASSLLHDLIRNYKVSLGAKEKNPSVAECTAPRKLDTKTVSLRRGQVFECRTCPKAHPLQRA